MSSRSRLTTQVRQGSGRSGEKLQADLHIVDAFGLCIHHEEAVIKVLFGPPPVGQEEEPQRQRPFQLQWPTTERPPRQVGPGLATPHPTHHTGFSKETTMVAKHQQLLEGTEYKYLTLSLGSPKDSRRREKSG